MSNPNYVKSLLQIVADMARQKTPDVFPEKPKFKFGDWVMVNSDWPVENRTKWVVLEVEFLPWKKQFVYHGKVIYPEMMAGRHMDSPESKLTLYKSLEEQKAEKVTNEN